MQRLTELEVGKDDCDGWLKGQHDRLTVQYMPRRRQAKELNDFRDMQDDFQAEARDTTAWLASGATSGTSFLDGMTSTFANSFEGGGGFMGGMKSIR